MDYFKGARDDDARESTAAIQVGVRAGSDAEEARWTFILTVFFRVVALWWIAEGLAQWRRILAPAEGSFIEYSAGSIAATIFFAVLDLVAAVGLWLIAPWGGVVWLLTLLAQFFVATIKPTFFFAGGGIRWLDGLLLALYLFLSWRANAASGEFGPLDRLFDKALGRIRSRKRPQGSS